MDKKELRKYALKYRKELDIEYYSELFTSKISQSEIFNNSNNIMIYYPLPNEIDFRNLIKCGNKNFYLPKVCNKDLIVCPWKCSTPLEKSCYNIMEPCSNPIDPEMLDLVVVPALMVDLNHYRLGYGGGFYDRFIGKYGENFTTISALPEQLIIDRLPVDNFDKKIDIIFSDNKIF